MGDMARSPQRAIVGRKVDNTAPGPVDRSALVQVGNPGSGHWVTMRGTHVFIKADGTSDHPAAAGDASNIVSHGKFFKGARVHYKGGRGPEGFGTVLDVGANSMLVQFDDRADTTTIKFSEPDWMNHLSVTAASRSKSTLPRGPDAKWPRFGQDWR